MNDLTNIKTTNPDDYVAYSEWTTFLDDDVTYWSQHVLRQAIGDLMELLNKEQK
jgi:hypothetical protein